MVCPSAPGASKKKADVLGILKNVSWDDTTGASFILHEPHSGESFILYMKNRETLYRLKEREITSGGSLSGVWCTSCGLRYSTITVLDTLGSRVSWFTLFNCNLFKNNTQHLTWLWIQEQEKKGNSKTSGCHKGFLSAFSGAERANNGVKGTGSKFTNW